MASLQRIHAADMRAAEGPADTTAGDPPPPPPPPWSQLPDGVVESIMGHLSFHERHQVAVLVCRQWERACHAPALLRDLSIGCPVASVDRSRWRQPAVHPWRMASLEALFAWIRRNSVGLHARRVAFPALQLAMPGYRTDDDAADEEDEDEFEDDYTAHAHRAALVGACLAALACPGDGPGGSSLQHLWLRLPSSPASLLGFPAGLTALTSLAVEAGETVRLGSAVRGLGALRRLDLRGSYLEGAANIPAGVTSLALVLDGQGAQLPAGVTQLALRSLTLERCSFEEQELAGLTRLTCLEHLGLVGMQVPDCLRELTWLGSLRLGSVYDRPGQILAPLGASPRDLLAPLARLTALALHSLMLSPANLAATLLSLPQLGQLQRLALCDTQDRPGRLDTCLAAGWRMHAGRRSIGIYCTAPLRPWPPRIPCSG